MKPKTWNQRYINLLLTVAGLIDKRKPRRKFQPQLRLPGLEPLVTKGAKCNTAKSTN